MAVSGYNAIAGPAPPVAAKHRLRTRAKHAGEGRPHAFNVCTLSSCYLLERAACFHELRSIRFPDPLWVAPRLTATRFSSAAVCSRFAQVLMHNALPRAYLLSRTVDMKLDTFATCAHAHTHNSLLHHVCLKMLNLGREDQCIYLMFWPVCFLPAVLACKMFLYMHACIVE